MRPRGVKSARGWMMFLPACLLLGGCVGNVTVPEDRFYRLPDTRPAGPLEQPLTEGTLSIARLRASGLYNERAILYIDAQRPLQLQRYHYHHWVESPPRLVQEHLLAYLRAAHAASLGVVHSRPGERTAVLVSGRLLRFERIIGPDGTRVVAALELEYTSPGSGRQDTLAHEYTASVQARDASLHASAAAFGAALGQIYQRFLADITHPR